MYQALYRKWRPKTFEDVVGQDHITLTLKNEVSAGKFSHAYLFTGSRGTGKTTCSKIVAKAVNCLHPQDGNPCNECLNCKGIDDGSILDVVEIDAASNNGVDNIRQLREEAYFLPSVAKYRVYILDECHMLSAGAVNALLKILEEPPEHVIFILATTEIHKVLPTILSRCQRFDFKRIKSQVIAERLLYVAEQENIHLEKAAAMLIARLSDGGMRDALSLLDLCISYAQQITEQTVVETAGLTGQGPLFELVRAIIQKDPAGALRVVDQLSENSMDFTRLCEQMVIHYRNLMIVKTVKDPEDLIQMLPEDLQKLREQSAQVSLNTIMSGLEILQDTMGKISRTAFKRTEFEMAVIRLCDMPASFTMEEFAQRLDRLEMSFASEQPPARAVVQQAVPASSAAGSPKAEKPPQAPPSSLSAADEAVPFEKWAEVLQELQKINGALYGAMIESRAFICGELVLIDCANDMFKNLLRTSLAAKESLRNAIMKITGQKYNLGPYNPDKYRVSEAQKNEKSDPLEGVLKKASELNVPVDIK